MVERLVVWVLATIFSLCFQYEVAECSGVVEWKEVQYDELPVAVQSNYAGGSTSQPRS